MKRLATLPVLLSLVLALSACGDDETTTTTPSGEQGGISSPDSTAAEDGTSTTDVVEMTKEKWQAVDLGATREEIIDQVGEPTSESEDDDLVTLTYVLTSPSGTMVGFGIEGGELRDKKWDETTYTGGEISAAEYEKVEDGMTESEVEGLLGSPSTRTDEVTDYSLGPSMGKNPSGTLQRCFVYKSTQESGGVYEICFSTDGKVNWTYPPPGNGG